VIADPIIGVGQVVASTHAPLEVGVCVEASGAGSDGHALQSQWVCVLRAAACRRAHPAGLISVELGVAGGVAGSDAGARVWLAEEGVGGGADILAEAVDAVPELRLLAFLVAGVVDGGAEGAVGTEGHAGHGPCICEIAGGADEYTDAEGLGGGFEGELCVGAGGAAGAGEVVGVEVGRYDALGDAVSGGGVGEVAEGAELHAGAVWLEGEVAGRAGSHAPEK
jgi:hypothetical protein